MKEIAPSPGAKAVNLLPVRIKEILTALRIPELGCLASIPTFSITIPFAWVDPRRGSCLRTPPWRLLVSRFLNFLSFQRNFLRSFFIFGPENNPRPITITSKERPADLPTI